MALRKCYVQWILEGILRCEEIVYVFSFNLNHVILNNMTLEVLKGEPNKIPQNDTMPKINI